MSYLISLPEESLRGIAQFLLPQDVLNFITIHPSFVPLLCHSKQFWVYLYEVHYGAYENRNIDIAESSTNHDSTCIATDWVKVKNQYLLKSYCSALPMVRWYPVDTKPPKKKNKTKSSKKRKTDGVSTPIEPLFVYEEPPDHEDAFGLSSCIGNYIVLYVNSNLFIKNIQQLNDGTTWKRLLSVNCSHLKHIFWAGTLNTLDNTRAVMFGGRTIDHGSGDTAQVAVLHVEEIESENEATVRAVPNVWWEVIDQCHVSDNPSMTCSDSNSSWLSLAGRSHHASTLLFNRYLFVVGGIQNDYDNILKPILLDCQTWTWYVDGVITSCTTSNISNRDKRKLFPSKRHGCSMIADIEHRNRLILFGGGIGYGFSEVSGNSEVWELKMNDCNSIDTVLSSMPWKWNLLHQDQTEPDDQYDFYYHGDDDDEDESHDSENETDLQQKTLDEVRDQINPANVLRFVERLNLGQCHTGYRVGRDTVILAFGNVNELMTNSVLCYNLKDDCFFRTHVHDSFHPYARNMSASAYIESTGIIVFYGGVSDYFDFRDCGCVFDTILLDLAPAMNVQKLNSRLWLPIDTDADRSHTPTKVRWSKS
jgi:hypothetical protein